MDETKARSPRYQVAGMNIIYDTGESFWAGPVVDVSESGLFIETHHELAIGTRVILVPDLPECDDALPFEIPAEVARVNEVDLDNHFDRTPGIAFRLVELSNAELNEVRQFLKSHGVPVHGAGS